MPFGSSRIPRTIDGDLMRKLTHQLAALMAGLALLLAAAPLGATPEQVIADHADDGIIEGTYSTGELQAALDLAQRIGGPHQTAAIRAIREAERNSLLGVNTGQPGQTASALERSSTPSAADRLGLPQAPATPPGVSVPLPFVVLSSLAAVLLVGGATSGLIRRRLPSTQTRHTSRG